MHLCAFVAEAATLEVELFQTDAHGQRLRERLHQLLTLRAKGGGWRAHSDISSDKKNGLANAIPALLRFMKGPN